MLLLAAIWGVCLMVLMVVAPISLAAEGDWVGVAIFLALYLLVGGGIFTHIAVEDGYVRRWRARRANPQVRSGE
jgi:small basic protein